MLKESVDGLDINPDGVYVDVTFGGGGHSREILSRLGDNGHLFSFDQDADAENNIVDDPRFTFVHSNFRWLSNWMRYYDIEHIDGLLAVRTNREGGKTAADIVNDDTEEHLADIFYLYGELRRSRQIAAAIVKARQRKPILTTQDFLQVVDPLFRREKEKKDMARLFQALRIEVNHEMQALSEMLTSATRLLAKGGRLSVITYHSLEDRMVKNIMKSGNVNGKVEEDPVYGRKASPYDLVNNKVIVPSDEEVERNPRSRSAKLRIAEKKEE